jgi:hypothetical protein
MPQHHGRAMARDLDEILGGIRSWRLKESHHHLIDDVALAVDQIGETGSPRLKGRATKDCPSDARGVPAGDAHDSQSAPSEGSGDRHDGVFEGQTNTFSRRGAESAEKKLIVFFSLRLCAFAGKSKSNLPQSRKVAKEDHSALSATSALSKYFLSLFSASRRLCGE